MIKLVEGKRNDIILLCRRYRVQRLELFGSAAGVDLAQEKSGLDFLVQFEPCTASEHYNCYFALLEALQRLSQKDIDLVEAHAMQNPYFIRRVNKSRKPIYAV